MDRGLLALRMREEGTALKAIGRILGRTDGRGPCSPQRVRRLIDYGERMLFRMFPVRPGEGRDCVKRRLAMMDGAKDMERIVTMADRKWRAKNTVRLKVLKSILEGGPRTVTTPGEEDADDFIG